MIGTKVNCKKCVDCAWNFIIVEQNSVWIPWATQISRQKTGNKLLRVTEISDYRKVCSEFLRRSLVRLDPSFPSVIRFNHLVNDELTHFRFSRPGEEITSVDGGNRLFLRTLYSSVASWHLFFRDQTFHFHRNISNPRSFTLQFNFLKSISRPSLIRSQISKTERRAVVSNVHTLFLSPFSNGNSSESWYFENLSSSFLFVRRLLFLSSLHYIQFFINCLLSKKLLSKMISSLKTLLIEFWESSEKNFKWEVSPLF